MPGEDGKAKHPTVCTRAVVWAASAVLSLGILAAATQDPTLRVVSASPTGDLRALEDADQVRIIFSEAMVPLGTVPSGSPPPWIRISPSAPGSFYWSGTKTLIFSPDATTGLPYATRFTVRLDGTATSANGRTLGAPYEFTFSTPTVRLLSAHWSRKTDRFDSPVILALHFNQPVAPDVVATHVRVTLTPHAWVPPAMSERTRRILQEKDPQGLRRFDEKVEAVRNITQRSDRIDLRVADSWNERQFPRKPGVVVLETIGAPPPTDSWLTVAFDDGLPSPDGPEKTAAQSTIVKLDSTFFARGTQCSVACDPSEFNSLNLTQMVPLNALARALSIVDVTDPDRERALAPSRPVDASDSQVIGGPSPRSAGFDAQPAARTWRLHLSADLTARDGQTLGYPWVGFVENGHALPWIRLEGTVWEARGGPRLPLIARNVSSVTHSLVPLDSSSLMPRLLARERERRVWRPSILRPPVVGEAQRLNFSPSVAEAHGLDIRHLLTSQGRGLLWASVSAVDLFSGPMPRRSPDYDTWALHASSDVQVTNLGISVKDSPQSTLVFVTQLDTALPVADASVAIVDVDNRTVWRGATDRSGVALAPPLSLRQRNRPNELSFVVTAEKDGDFAYVGSDWADREVLSEPRIRHEPTASAAVLRGSVFTDRGVYKKSEEIHFKAVLRDDTPGGMQLTAAGNTFDVIVRDARNRDVDRRKITVNQWSSAEWTWRVPNDAGLGSYRIEVGRAGLEPDYESTVRGGFLVAAFRRPDFRVDASLEADPPILGTTLRAAVEAKYLFGGPLGTRSVYWWAAREPVQRSTDAIRNRYPESRYAVGYLPRWDERPRRAQETKSQQEMLGADGRLTVSLPTPGEGNAAYSYRFEATVQDVSGQHIANRASFVLHPSSVYVAMMRPPMFVETKTGASVGVTVANLAGEPVAGVPVHVSLLREEWVSITQPGRAGLDWERREIPAGEWTVQSAAGDTSLQIPVRDGGCYVLRAIARDAAGRQTRTDVTFYAIGPGVSSWRIEGNRINLTPERKTWKPGETARILIQSPWERATALLTVEREGIRSHRTFTISSMQDTVDVPITEADIPNVYVSVMLVKGRTSENGDDDPGRPSYRVGYTELSVDDASKRLRVDVSTDREEYRPRQPVRVSVAVGTRDGKPVAGEVTLWAIDYGLLSLTNYSTPDVLKAIYVSKPLQVTTQDNRERLIRRRPLASSQGPAPLVAGELGETVMVTAMGMGHQGPVIAFMASLAQQDASRPPVDIRSDFRPLVFWLGSTTTDASGRATTRATLPDSLTTYRVMAVVGDGSSRFGFGEREIRVSKALTLLPAFPRFLTKGDRASFGAVVTNSGTQAGEAIVTIESLDTNRLQFGNTVQRMISLPAGVSEHVRFDAVARASGTARARMLVRLGSDTDAFEMPLVVGEPLRHEVTAAYGDTLGTATETVTLDSKARPETATLTVDLASTALVGMGESARYLDDYPYECAEQKASRALALLLAADLGGAFKLTDVQPDDYKEQASRALSELYDFQCGYAGFALWPGRCDTQSAYLTAYILHVLKVAETLKYTVDRNAIDGALYYLQRQLQEKPAEVQWWPVWAASQAYALKVLAEFGRSQPKEIDRVATIADRLPIFALSYLADALAASNNRGSQYRDIVRRLLNALRVEADRAHVEETDEDTLAWLWNTNVSATSVVLEGLSRRNDDPALIPALARWLLAARTNGRWGTTHENAKALEALVSYYRAFESEAPQMNAVVKVGPATLGTAAFEGRSTTSHQLRISILELLKRTSTSSSTMSITKTGTGRLYYTARVERFVPESPEPADRGFHVVRRYERYRKDGSGPPTTTFEAGDLVRVTITVTLRAEGRYLALTDPLPAGVEPIDALLQTTSRDLAEESTRGTGATWVSWWRRGTFDHVEKHDDRVVAFATRLGSGRHEFSYLVRATTAGTFTAAGSRLEAMYAPELGGRGAAATITIK